MVTVAIRSPYPVRVEKSAGGLAVHIDGPWAVGTHAEDLHLMDSPLSVAGSVETPCYREGASANAAGRGTQVEGA
ncbi:hypothetical protein GCM10009090_16300 [[Pseudomonas] boreopolis]|uniref:Uncharacterized protein n=1 Tax=Xanthomonas boreopolis TaxID=86183 RepID=A0A919F779_9XANT|nr:hypothetical protein GCM10009090_16300 [[Pseudomonas] boreopolis]